MSPGTASSPEGQALVALPLKRSFQPLLGRPGTPSQQGELQGHPISFRAAISGWVVFGKSSPPAAALEQAWAGLGRGASCGPVLLCRGLTELAQGAPGGGAGAGSQALLWDRAGQGAGGQLWGSPTLLLLLGLGPAAQGQGPPQGALAEGVLKGTRTKVRSLQEKWERLPLMFPPPGKPIPSPVLL